MARDGGPWACRGGGRAARPGMFAAYAAWSAREIELQVLATLAALAQDLHTVCRSFPKISSALSAKFAADRDRQRSSFNRAGSHSMSETGGLGHVPAEGRVPQVGLNARA